MDSHGAKADLDKRHVERIFRLCGVKATRLHLRCLDANETGT